MQKSMFFGRKNRYNSSFHTSLFSSTIVFPFFLNSHFRVKVKRNRWNRIASFADSDYQEDFVLTTLSEKISSAFPFFVHSSRFLRKFFWLCLIYDGSKQFVSFWVLLLRNFRTTGFFLEELTKWIPSFCTCSSRAVFCLIG